MANDAHIKAVITADDRASAALSKFGKHVNGVGQKVAKVAKIAAVGVAAASTAAVAFGVHAVKAFDEAQKGIAQTNAVLASTKGIAGVTGKAVTDLATKLEKLTTFSDEEVRSAENMLLTFTRIGKDVFPQATKTVLNMATALGEDTKSASIQLGKALQDPILGVTALRRVGVNFSESQKDVIKNLVETGRSAEAQKLILKELQTEFGGSAEAARNTFGGSLKALWNQLNNVEEKVGQVISNALQPFIQKAADFLAKIDWEGVINRSIGALRVLWQDHLVPMAKAVGDVAVQIEQYLFPKLEALWHTIQDNLWPAVKNFVTAFGPDVGVGLVWAVGASIDMFNAFLKIVSPIIDWMSQHTGVVYGFAAAFAALKLAIMLQGAIAAFEATMAAVQVAMLPTVAQLGVTRGAFALLAGTISSPIVMPAIAVGAALIALWKVRDAAFEAWDAVQNAKNAAQSLQESNLAVKSRLQGMLLSSDPAVRERAAKALAGLQAEGMFASGGYTGQGAANEVAGIVHKGEYVLPQSAVDQSTGTPKLGGGTVHFHVNIGMYAGTPMERRNIAKQLFRDFQDAARQFGTAPSDLLNGTNGMIIR